MQQLRHPLRKVRPRYKELLNKFKSDPELLELFEEAIMDKANEEMVYYFLHGEYPKEIKVLDKLKHDLYTITEWVKMKQNE